MKKIGFTTTIPVEIILSAGFSPIDLNNIFISDKNPQALVDYAHSKGLPRNLCAWIKGLYSVAALQNAVDEIIVVKNGDCSNSHALADLYEDSGMKVHSFSYPNGEKEAYLYLKKQMTDLAASLGTTLDKAIEYSKKTDKIRENLRKLDEMTVEGYISGFENHLYLVSSTDFGGDVDKFSAELDGLIKKAEARKIEKKNIKIGIIGVPTINPTIYDFIEEKNCKIVFNEIERQFSIVSQNPDYVARYLEYTYPYSTAARIKEIKEQINIRKIDGIIHYVQSFCFRQMQDVLMRKYLGVPILTIEGDSPGDIDGRTKIRIDSFIEMLEHKKHK